MSLRFLSVNQMSEMTGIDRRTVRKRIEGLTGQKGAKNGTYYDAFEALPRLYHQEGSKHDVATAMRNETLLLERAKRQRLDLDIKRIRGEYISIEEVAKAVETEYSYVRSQLRSLASKLAKPLAILNDPHEVQAAIEESVNECLTELVSDTDYKERKDEFERARVEVKRESKEDHETDSKDEPSGVGGSIQVSES